MGSQHRVLYSTISLCFATQSVCALQHNQSVLCSTMLCFAAQCCALQHNQVVALQDQEVAAFFLAPWLAVLAPWKTSLDSDIHTWFFLFQNCCSQGAIVLADPLRCHRSDPATRTASLRQKLYSHNNHHMIPYQSYDL